MKRLIGLMRRIYGWQYSPAVRGKISRREYLNLAFGKVFGVGMALHPFSGAKLVIIFGPVPMFRRK